MSSVSALQRPRPGRLRAMYVIGTAGHVDHGKSALVEALTGIHPDRLREERERGLTIELGFAWMSLPSGRDVSIVDVPGHVRFVRHMLAGVGAIDLALLVVGGRRGRDAAERASTSKSSTCWSCGAASLRSRSSTSSRRRSGQSWSRKSCVNCSPTPRWRLADRAHLRGERRRARRAAGRPRRGARGHSRAARRGPAALRHRSRVHDGGLWHGGDRHAARRAAAHRRGRRGGPRRPGGADPGLADAPADAR